MSKKAFFKKLIVAGLCAVTATATVGMTACNNDKDKENEKQEETVQYNVTWNLDGGEWAQGATVGATKVDDGAKIAKPSDPVKSGYTFEGWVKEDGSAFNFDAAISANTTIKATWKEETTVNPPPGEVKKVIEPTLTDADDNDPVPDAEGNITISYTLNPSELESLSGDTTVNVFTVSSGIELRSRSRSYAADSLTFTKSLNLKDKQLKLNASAAGKLTLYIGCGSGNRQTAGFLFNGQKVAMADPDTNAVNKIELNVPAAGVYTIARDDSENSTNDVYYAVFETKSPVTQVEKIEVENGGKTDYFLGQEFSTEGLKVNVVYKETGVIKAVPVGRLKIDYTEFDSSASGEATIKLSYKKKGLTYKTEYKITVYELQSIELAKYTTNGAKQTTLKEVYLKGDQKLDTAGLTVTANTKYKEQTAKFVLNADRFTVSEPDLNTVGEKTVTITSKDKADVTASYKIYVVEQAAVVSNAVTVTVDPAQNVSSTNFKTVSQALTYLARFGADVVKNVEIADGEYYEKISVDIKNVRLKGSATATPDGETNNGVVLWFDAFSGLTDAIGKVYGTNGSASVTVTSNATGFVAENITFKNHYNTVELYLESKATGKDTQAVALLVESTSAEFYNCKMTGYHDTLYANKGKQYYNNCWIEGRTDFIFGQDANAYFYGCTVKTLSAGDNDGDGGYTTALKPSASTYYFVYNGCNFIADATGATNIALGRAWGPEMKMVIMNSNVSDAYSTTAHTAGNTKKERYCTMSGNEPKPANMLEYRNAGAGAITASLANTCTVISASDAANYGVAKITTILGFTPKTVPQTDPDPTV